MADIDFGAQSIDNIGARRIRVQFLKELEILWDWNDLLQNAETNEANLNLAIAGIILSNSVEMAAKAGEAFLTRLGFENIKSDYYLLSSENRNGVNDPARTYGHKLLIKDGKEYHIFCAAYKGTTTLSDCITDINSVKDGFYTGGKNCTESLKAYIDGFDGACKDNTVLFITGHSLGASIANVVGRLSRSFVNSSSEFVYSFASPNYDIEGERNGEGKNLNFHTFTFADDIVPRVPLSIPPRFFSKIGREHIFDLSVMTDDKKQRFNRAY